MKLRKMLAALLAGVMTVSALCVSSFAAYVQVTDEFDPSGEYSAQMFIQNGGSWAFRDPTSNDDTGRDSGYAGADKITVAENGEIKEEYEGTFTDVTLAGNGDYTLTLDAPSFGDAATNFNLIGISTDIPATAAETVKFTNVKITVNDSSIMSYTYDEGVVDPDCISNNSYINVLGVNIWNSETCADANTMLGGTDVWPGTVSKVEISFTVSGFDYDKAADETEAPADNETEAPDDATEANDTADTDSESTGLSTGAIIGIVAAVVVVVIIIIVIAASSSKKKKAK